VSAGGADRYVRRHLRFGWGALGVFGLLGIVLESLHAFKIGWYLDVSNETRRLMWTLAHAHGTLLALVNIAFAATVSVLPAARASVRGFASTLLCLATVAMPLGFLIGGLFPMAGDPSLGVLLLPIGSVLLLISIAFTIP
jgi:hypothetical protein